MYTIWYFVDDEEHMSFTSAYKKSTAGKIAYKFIELGIFAFIMDEYGKILYVTK